MNKQWKHGFIICFTILQISMLLPSSLAFEVQTHRIISEAGTRASSLNNFLTTVLPRDFPQGIDEVLVGGRKPIEFIQDGSENEDKPAFRSRHHFHDPTRTWDQAGLQGVFSGQSSILWSQSPNQGLGGNRSWQNARQTYFEALTARDPVERKRLFAETFRTLGHLIHHVQDAAVPSHTRNDEHIGGFLGNGYGVPIGNPDRFHHWAQIRGGASIAGNQGFNTSVLSVPPNPFAPIPIARIIDATDDDRGTPSAGNDIGIAEYSSGNFFSDDTIFRNYAHPTPSSMDLVPGTSSNGLDQLYYFVKTRGPGDTGYRAAVASRVAAFTSVATSSQQLELDDNVMADYGARLFPRAIGYSAGLIDYFFRGTTNGFALDGYLWDPWPDIITSVNIKGLPDESIGQGELFLVLQVERTFESPNGYTHVTDHYEVSDPVPYSGGTGFRGAQFHFPNGYVGNGNITLSPFSPPRFLYWVFRGRVGNEDGAVLVSFYSGVP